MITRSGVGACIAGVLLGAAACRSNFTTPTEPPLTAASESSHFVYHHAPEDRIDILWEENYYAWLVG